MGPNFEDVAVGDEIPAIARVFTKEMVNTFCSIWGAGVSNRFTDDDAAKRDGLPKAITPGIMNMAVLGSVLTAWAPDGQVRRLETLFRRPVFHDRPLRALGSVSAKNVVDGVSQVECDVQLQSEDGETLVMGSATVVLPSSRGS